MHSQNNILQWNINGLRGKCTQLQCLLGKYNPNIIALQETKLPPNITYEIKKNKFHNFHKNGAAHGGGVALYISKNLPTKEVQLQTNLEAVAATVWYQHTKMTACSLYLNPDIPFPINDFIALLDELPSPYLILGDFNCKNSLWGSPRVVANEPIAYRRGTDLLNIIEPRQLHILNTGRPTRVQLRNQTYSHIDLSIGSPEICTNFNWNTEPNPHGSDHLPIIVSNFLIICIRTNPPDGISKGPHKLTGKTTKIQLTSPK